MLPRITVTPPIPVKVLVWTLLSTLILASSSRATTQEEPPSPTYQDWLEQVDPIITDAERQTFAALQRDYQRNAFIQRFWSERDGLLPVWEQRRRLATELFGDLEGDRARTLLLLGPPELMLGDLCPELARPLEAWYYGQSHAFEDGFFLIFVVQGDKPDSPQVHWRTDEGVESLFRPGVLADQDLDTLLSQLYRRCSHGRQMREVATHYVDWDQLREQDHLFPAEPDRWVDEVQHWTSPPADNASDLAAMLRVEFPGGAEDKTVTQVELSLPTPVPGNESGHDDGLHWRLIGELLRQDRLHDSFRYDFELPPEAVGRDQTPLIFQRYLLTGDYTLILLLEDRRTSQRFHGEFPIQVPPPGAVAPVAGSRLSEANSVLNDTDSWVKIEPLSDRLLIGKVRVAAAARGEAIAKVTFVLNGRPVMSKIRPPYGIEIDLGPAPRLHTLEAVAYDATGHELARDRVPINAGPHRFAVRLLEPRPGQRYVQSLRAAAEVDLPAGESIERVDFYLNEMRLASLFQPPFVQPMVLPESQRITYARAVAYLDDGHATEDLVFINAPDDMDRLRINMVELYTTVTDKKGRPVEGLTQEAFVVTEEGQPHDIRRFDLVRDMSIHAGVVVDASTSMREEIDEAIDGALSFFETVIQPKDRATAVVFNDEPLLEVPFTNSIDVLRAGLDDVVAEGETALYDTLVFTLHYFSGIRGKRALILISDGEDSRSRFSFAETLEFAQRSGVAVYAIGLGLDSRRLESRNVLVRLATETGGRFFTIASARELGEIYLAIENELRSQYLLVYQSSHEQGGDFRKVEVQVDGSGLKARTIPGYYP